MMSSKVVRLVIMLATCTLGLGAVDQRVHQQKLRGTVSKRHRIVKLWVLIFALVTSLASRAQDTSDEHANGPTKVGHSSACDVAPMDAEKVKAWKARAKRNFEHARYGYLNSIEHERKLGERLAREIDKYAQFSSDSETQEYMSGLGQRLAMKADAGVPFTVKIIQADEVNVFSLPGGFLYVTTGLISSTQSEAQLAGLLEHEVAHVLARHGSRQRKKQSIMKWTSMPLMFVGPVGLLVRQVAGITMPLKFSRDAEIEADVIGIELLSAAGYDSFEYVNWLKAAAPCETNKPSKLERVFDSYPVFQERLALIESRLADLPRRAQLIVSTSEFEEIRTKWSSAGVPHLRQGSNRPILKRRWH